MKKILLTILAVLIVPLLLAFPVFAQEKNIILERNETVDRDYFAGGDRVEVLGTVNGDAYIGGGTVIVDGRINGDLLVGGGNITISGIIQGDVRVGGGNITFSNALVGGNVTAGGGNITIGSSSEIQGSLVSGAGTLQVLAPIGRGATIGGGSVMIGNSVGGDVLAGVSELSLSNEANINGDLTYWSENKASISNEASVSGTVKQEVSKKADSEGVEKAAGIFAAGLAFTFILFDNIWLLIIGLALLFFFPVYTNKTSSFIKEKFGWALLTGFLGVILIPAVILILFITLVGIPLAVVVLVLYLFMLWFARIFAIYALGQLILSRSKNKTNTYLTYILGVVVYFILSLIPIISTITQIVVLFAGVGAFLAMKRNYYTELRGKKTI